MDRLQKSLCEKLGFHIRAYEAPLKLLLSVVTKLACKVM
jgi:hypothetical protein